MLKSWLKAVALIIFLPFLVIPVNGAKFTRDANVLTISDDINRTDHQMFQLMLDTFEEIDTVQLFNSNGGNFDSATKIGIMIKDRGLNTDVKGYCYSACTYIWLAGNKKTFNKNTQVGIHLPGIVGETESDAVGTRFRVIPIVVSYMNRIEIPRSFTDLVISVRFNEVMYLTDIFLKYHGIEASLKDSDGR